LQLLLRDGHSPGPTVPLFFLVDGFYFCCVLTRTTTTLQHGGRRRWEIWEEAGQLAAAGGDETGTPVKTPAKMVMLKNGRIKPRKKGDAEKWKNKTENPRKKGKERLTVTTIKCCNLFFAAFAPSP
jgi:hypothetical protein